MLLIEETKTQLGVDTTQLKPQSNKVVIVKCNYCPTEFQILYYRWTNAQKHNTKTACKNCRNKKREETNLKIHGVKNISESKITEKKRAEIRANRSPEEKAALQKKVEAGQLKSLGFIPFQSKEFQTKIQDEREQKTGYRNPWNNPDIIKKRKQTFQDKYGFNTPAKSPKTRAKIRETRLKRGQTRRFKGKELKQLAIDSGFAYSTISARVQRYGIESLENLKRSKTEIEVVIETILKELNVSYKFRYRQEQREIDFYIPQHNLGIEADGLYWHSDAIPNTKTAYHKNKKEHFKNLGIEVLFFREDEINNKKDIIKSIILNKLRRSQAIGARKTEVKSITIKEAKMFFLKNHLMNMGRGSTIGLLYQGEIQASIQYFKKSGEIEISRYCCKLETQVQGGLSKLLKVIQNTNPDTNITSFVDLRYGNGKSLETLGFKKISEHLSFKWVKSRDTYHRLKFPGNSGYDHKMHKIWDCGQAKFKLNLK